MKISIASGKGGTGKTTISTNLAEILSEEFQVVLSDLDVEEPNASLFYCKEVDYETKKVYKQVPVWDKEKCILCGHCQKVCNFNAIMKLGTTIVTFPNLCHSCFACSELCPTKALDMQNEEIGEINFSNFDKLSIIEGQMLPGQEMAVPVIKDVKKFASHQSAVFYINDCPPGTACPMVESIKDADYVILVTEPTPFGLHDLKMAIKVLQDLSLNFGIVINKYVKSSETEQYLIENKINIIGKVPLKESAAKTYSKGDLLIKHDEEIYTEFLNIKKYLLSLKKSDINVKSTEKI